MQAKTGSSYQREVCCMNKPHNRFQPCRVMLNDLPTDNPLTFQFAKTCCRDVRYSRRRGVRIAVWSWYGDSGTVSSPHVSFAAENSDSLITTTQLTRVTLHPVSFFALYHGICYVTGFLQNRIPTFYDAEKIMSMIIFH